MKNALSILTMLLITLLATSCKGYDEYTKEEAYAKAKNEMRHINGLDIVNNGLEIYSLEGELEYGSFLSSTTIKDNSGIYLSEMNELGDKAVYAWNYDTFKEFNNEVLTAEKPMKKDFFENRYLGVQRLNLDILTVIDYEFEVFETSHAWGGKSLYIEHSITFDSDFSITFIYLDKVYTLIDVEVKLWTGIWKGSMTIFGYYYENSILKNVKYLVSTNTSFSESEYSDTPYYVW
ncbi:hypothetical protein LJC17_02150 [Acholeplasma sp. OttesenSCG-928-E16]|nr:hypothetical protein [Acholeplasma sp. OttesenSCG-928-E16]